MIRQPKGFTLIELVVVIVLLGILSVTAVSRFIDLSNDAANSVTKTIAAEISSAGLLNYLKSTTQGDLTGLVDVKSQVADCNTLKHLMSGGFSAGLPNDVEFVQPSHPISCSPHAAGGTNNTSCLLKHQRSATLFPVVVYCTSSP